ncbi:MAG: ferrous iron transporter B [Lawsonella sp.]
MPAEKTTSFRIALVGSPNAGKSSIFNSLTGLNAKTGNYPGVTVTHTEGPIDNNIILEDLPGTYSLDPISPDEQVVTDLLEGRLEGVESPDALLLVVDSTTLNRSLTLVAQALAENLPTAVVLTMTDELEQRGGNVNSQALAVALGVPVVRVVATQNEGISELRTIIDNAREWGTCIVPPPSEPGPERDSWAHSMMTAAQYRAPHSNKTTDKVDRVLLHPVWGTLLFFLIMFGFFQIIFTVAAPFQGWIEDFFGWLGELSANHISNPVLGNFVNTALLGGIGGVLVFVPQIVLMFLLVSLLENVGYMSRAAFLMDKVMSKAGLEGRAFVAMLSSFACAVPGIMATRTMPSSRDRIATIMGAPLMTCSARLPVYLLLTGMLISDQSRVGLFSTQGLVMFGLYLLGGFSAMAAALIFKRTVLRSGLLPFYMEMPPYRVPTVKSVVRDMWESTRVFLVKVGKIILATTVVLWVLLNVPTQTQAIEEMGLDETEATQYVTENSVAATIGKAVEPVFEPLGFDWRINIGLMGSMAAREVFVATLGQVAAAEDPEDPVGALKEMTYTHGEREGQKVFTPPTTVALLIFFVYALQCMSTVGAIRRETNSWRWPIIAFTYMFVVAWVMAFLARLLTLAII